MSRCDPHEHRLQVTTGAGGGRGGIAYAFRISTDEDGTGVPDACECLGDVDHDQDVDQHDLGLLLANFGRTYGKRCP
ncbi:MAG: hypothetical protein KAS72_14280 [Phycisphaerales bacterium]|nr:hypothetical protein [Phycisphaerales bacterium]